MEKKFKHRETGDIAYYKDGVFKQGRCCVDIGHEPSNEFWEDITEDEALFVTYDGVSIFKGDTYYVPQMSTTTKELRGGYLEFTASNEGKEGYTTFAKRENAEKYVEDNKKRYSKLQIEEAIKTVLHIVDPHKNWKEDFIKDLILYLDGK